MTRAQMGTVVTATPDCEMTLRLALQETLRTQVAVARDFLVDPRFREPVIVIWVASFGSALHYPVTFFYLLEVGATKMDIGWLGFIASLGSLVCGPLYGWLLDNHGSLTAVSLAAAACSIGCLVRGMAIDVYGLYIGYFILGIGAENLWTCVLSHVARFTEPSQRVNVISGYLFQVTALRIIGRALYPPFNSLLEDGFQIQDTLPRMRIHMGMCTAFCFFGTARLVGNWGMIQESSETKEPFSDPNLGSGTGGFAAVASPFMAKGSEPQPAKFCLFAALLVLQSVCVTVANTLWPLYLQDEFGWGPRGYAPLVFLSSVFSAAAITLAPVLGRSMGHLQVLVFTYVLGALSAAVTFSMPNGTTTSVGGHCLSFILLLTTLALLEPVLKANASVSMPEKVQGVSFGVMGSIAGVGVMVGSPLATYLYNLSSVPTIEADGVQGVDPGVLPMWTVGGILACSALLLLGGVVVGGIPAGDRHGHPK
eukprot:m.16369 g.16369  ORF g.16369 m.16369 type:complete len:481 (+) comp3378_c0_seq2:298-1740(+)